MAIVNSNALTHGVSGKVGNVVFRQVGGKTVISSMPRKTTNPPTASVQENRDRFKSAFAYARHVLATPAMAALYTRKKKPGLHVMNIAIKDAMNAPEIKKVDLSAYESATKKGGKILIQVMDDFKVAMVTVTVYTEDGRLVEEGNACQAKGRYEWRYTAKFAPMRGTYIRILAKDLPGNETGWFSLL